MVEIILGALSVIGVAGTLWGLVSTRKLNGTIDSQSETIKEHTKTIKAQNQKIVSLEEEMHRLYDETRRFAWEDIQNAARELGRKLHADGFVPDIIFVPRARSAIVAYLLVEYMERPEVPMFVGIEEDNRAVQSQFKVEIVDYVIAKTAKWTHWIPNAVLQLKDKRILIVDDFAHSGDSLFEITQVLLNAGFTQEGIKTATVVCTSTAEIRKRVPHYKYASVRDIDFTFPWGKAR
jgi:hypoxanthine phosphoribosyltransferase